MTGKKREKWLDRIEIEVASAILERRGRSCKRARDHRVMDINSARLGSQGSGRWRRDVDRPMLVTILCDT